MERVEGERLVGLFENHELGLKPKTVYELAPEFFRSFASGARLVGRRTHSPFGMALTVAGPSLNRWALRVYLSL